MKREAYMEKNRIVAPVSRSKPKAQEGAGQIETPVRYISPRKHREIKRKVFTLHDGLLRKLAEHDRQSK